MKKQTYIFILLVVLPILFMISCGEDKSDDVTPPRITNVRFNVNDTIRYKENGVDNVIILNDSILGDLDTDILVIGKRIRFRGHFSDDQGLSTAYFHIWGDTLQINDTDASYNLRRLIPTYMFGKTESKIDSLGIVVADPLPVMVKSKDLLTDLLVRESGEKGEAYYFSVRCADVVGNEDTTSYYKYPITVRHRKSIIDEWKANNGSFRRR